MLILSFLISLLMLPGCTQIMEQAGLLFPSPLAPDNLAVSPTTPSYNTAPTITGTTSPSVLVKLYSAYNCSGSVLGTATAAADGSFSITSSVLTEGSYDFSVQSTDSGGASCSESSVDYVVDTTAPTIRFSAPSVSVVNSGSAAVIYSVTYHGASAVNLQASDVSLNVTGSASCATVTVTNGTAYIPTVSLSGCSGDGTVGISIAAGTASDSAGNTAGASDASSSFTIDNSGLTSATYDPDTGIFSNVPASVTITFSETISGTSVDTSDFSVTGTCAILPNLIVTSAVGSAATVSLAGASCSVGETVTLTTDLAGIDDASGNAGTGSVAATYTIDDTGPTTANFNPVTARFSSIPATLTLTFDESITPSSLTSADFVVTGTCTVLPVLSVTNISGALADLALSGASCSLDQTVTLTVDLTGITDITGNPGVGSFSETYTFDNLGPAVISINPVTASVSLIPASVAITFDENLLTTSAVDTDLIVSGTCSTLPAASLLSVAGTNATFDLTGASCSPGQTVIVTMNGPAVTDDAGNAGSGSVSATYTFDDMGPVASSTSPVSGSVNAIPASVTVYFDEVLLSSSVAATDMTASGSCSALPAISLLSVAGSTAVFGLSGAVCANGETAILTMNGSDVTDAAGNAGSGTATATFTIDSVGPTPLSVSPFSANLITMPASVNVTFDKSILASSVASSDLGISGTCTGLPTASVASVVGAVVTFALSAATCADGQTLILTLLGADVTDLAGNAGSNNQVVTYTKDTTGPSITSFSPVTSTVITIPTLVNVTFNEALLSGSVSAADFAISGTCNTLPVHSVLSISGQQVLLDLSGAVCDSGQTTILTVTASGISDTAGNAGAGTAAVTYTVDNIGPNVSSFAPNSGAPPASVIITFNENLNSSTVSLADFTLGGTCTTKTLSLTSVINNVVELAVNGAACAPSETVEITTNAANVTDSVGNAGSGTSVVTFTEP